MTLNLFCRVYITRFENVWTVLYIIIWTSNIILRFCFKKNPWQSLQLASYVQTKEGKGQSEFHLLWFENSKRLSKSATLPRDDLEHYMSCIGAFYNIVQTFRSYNVTLWQGDRTIWSVLSKSYQKFRGPEPRVLWSLLLLLRPPDLISLSVYVLRHSRRYFSHISV